jgi:hypothetical protein
MATLRPAALGGTDECVRPYVRMELLRTKSISP